MTMVSRRAFLAALPGVAVKPAKGADADFERIDTHTHIHRTIPPLLAAMEKAGWKGLSICDSRERADEASALPEMIRGTRQAVAESKGRLAWATTFDPRAFEAADFAAWVNEGLRQNFAQGALAVKIWKNVGMEVRSRFGEYLLPDHPVFAPILESIQRADKTLLTHLADLDVAWKPVDAANPDSGYYRSHPEWLMYGREGAPTKETILKARDRILARHPKLRVIGCHIGSSEEDLGRVAKGLDTYPNYAVDVASRVRFLARQDREEVRQFMLKYSERVLYATDYSPGAGNDEGAARSFLSTHEQEWSFFASGELLRFRDREVRGLALPAKVLRRIFHENAVRWLRMS
jgi:predicted TIM-barrel fold metal-dependent hydrolase